MRTFSFYKEFFIRNHCLSGRIVRKQKTNLVMNVFYLELVNAQEIKHCLESAA